jgi:hypothetical protein
MPFSNNLGIASPPKTKSGGSQRHELIRILKVSGG